MPVVQKYFITSILSISSQFTHTVVYGVTFENVSAMVHSHLLADCEIIQFYGLHILHFLTGD